METEKIIQIAVDQYGKEKFLLTSEGRIFKRGRLDWDVLEKVELPPLHNEINEIKDDERTNTTGRKVGGHYYSEGGTDLCCQPKEDKRN